MAVYFDQNGNLVDTEGNINFFNTSEEQVFPRVGYPNFGVPMVDDTSLTPNVSSSNLVSLIPNTGINTLQYPQLPANTLAGLNMDKFQGVSDMSMIDETTNDEQSQGYIDEVNQNNESGIMKLLKNLPTLTNLAAKILPKSTPEAIAMKNFYGSQYGLTPTGSVASGIMKGYNPVSGGFLNMISGGRFGQPAKVGLAGAIQERIEDILGRKAPQTDASRDKVAELQGLQLAEMRDRYDAGESLGSIGASTFSGPGMAFEAGNTDQGGGFTGGQVRDTGGVPGGKYGSPR